MTSDPEEAVRLQGYGEMTLRTAIATLMGACAARAIRHRRSSAFATARASSREIRTLASDWSIAPDAPHRDRPALAGHRPRHGSRSTAPALADAGIPARCAGGEAVSPARGATALALAKVRSRPRPETRRNAPRLPNAPSSCGSRSLVPPDTDHAIAGPPPAPRDRAFMPVRCRPPRMLEVTVSAGRPAEPRATRCVRSTSARCSPRD